MKKENDNEIERKVDILIREKTFEKKHHSSASQREDRCFVLLADFLGCKIYFDKARLHSKLHL